MNFTLTSKFLFFILFILCPTLSFCAEDFNFEPLVQGVFIGDVVYPPDKNDLQLSVMPQFENDWGAHTATYPFFIAYGLTNNLEIEAGWEAYKMVPATTAPSLAGSGDLAFALQYSVMHINNSLYSAAGGFGIGFPTGNINKGLTEGFMEYSPFVILAKDLPSFFKAHVYTQIGINFLDRVKTPILAAEENPAAHEFYVNGGLIIPYKKSFRGVIEMNWVNNEWNNNGLENNLYFTPGLIFHPNASIELGLGVPLGLTKFSDTFQVIGMLTVETKIL